MLAAIVENSNDAIVGRSIDGTIVSWNAAAERLFGYTAAEAIGRDLNLLPPELQQERRMSRDLVEQGTSIPSHETTRVTRDGRRIEVSLSVSPIKDGGGKVIGMATILRDNTQRKQAEETRAQLSAIVGASDDAILSRDLDGNILSWNAGAEQMFGYSAAEAIGRSVAILAPPERQYEAQHNTWLAQHGRRVPSFETVRVAKDGHPVHVQVCASAIRDEAGNATRIAAIYRDISARKQTEANLRKIGRARKVMAECNRVMVRADDEIRLLQDMCKTAVESGGYQMAWVGYAEHNEYKSVRPVAQSGFNEGYLEGLRISWGDKDSGRGPAGRAIRSGEVCVVRDTLSDPGFAPWRESALQRKYRSTIALPLRREGVAFGMLGLYTAETEAFDAEEVALLEELAADLAYGIVSLRARTAGARAEAALKANEELMRTTFEQAPIGVVHTSLDRRYLLVNQKFCNMIGYTRDELLAMKSPDITHPDDLVDEGTYRKRLLAGELNIYSGEKRYRRKDGTLIWTNRTVSLARDSAGQPLYFIRMIEDISKRKEAEDRFHATFEQAAVGIAHIGVNNFHILMANSKFCDLLGYTRDELIGTDSRLRSPAGDMPARNAERAQVLAGTVKTSTCERQLIRKDGSLLWVNRSLSLVRDSSGHPQYFISVIEDITERKLAAEMRTKLAAIVENSNDAIISRSLDWKILSWNGAAEHMFGYTAAEAIGQSIWMIIPPDREQEVTSSRAMLAQGRPLIDLKTVRLAKGGRRIDVSLSQSPLRDESGATTGASLIIRDISERKRVEEIQAQLAAIVENANDAIIGRTLDGTITSWNAAAERIFGYSASEAIGQPTAMLTPVSLRRQDANSENLRRGITVLVQERKRLTKDGRIISVVSSISPVRNEAGEVVSAAIITHDISELKQAERELRRKAELTHLMESLARAANEAASPEDALRECVARICDYGGWMLGRVATFAPGHAKKIPRSSIWHCPQEARFEEFINISNNFDHTHPGGKFVTAAIIDKKPIWVSDLSTTFGFGRMALAAKFGVRAGFVFPVVVGDDVLAVLEFFGGEPREPDTLLIEAIGGVGSQLARVIERQHALDEARASEQKLDSILGALHEVVWSMDPRSGRLLYLNAAAKRLTRRPVSDFLAKPRLWRKVIHREDRAGVSASVRTLMQEGRLTHEFRIVLADGESRTVENRAHVVRDAHGLPQRIDGTITDITERKQAEERSDYLAQYDTVTGLPNRQLFNDRLTLALARDKRTGAMTALLLIDLDRFKQINESLGHNTGDKVLQAVTARLKERLREVDTIARFGGDGFMVILEGISENAQVIRVGEKIVETMAQPFMLEDEEIFVTVSVGIALSPANADSVERLIENAELAMYQAKEEGRNTLQLYTPAQSPRRGHGLGMESKLRRAIERDELLLHYQPKVNIKTGAIVGAEALVRWRNPELGLVSPAEFIPLAEETGLIVPIGEWVLHTACTQASRWHRDGHPLAVAVNLSARQFRQKDLCDVIKRVLDDSALDAAQLELEITESMIMHHAEQAVATLRQLHDIGLTLSVDDFGTGYSSLSYLKRFPVHNLKIDQSFVRDLHKNNDDAAIVRTVIALAQNLNLKTIAEGVETEQQLIFLAGLHCDEYQGYYFSEPVPAAGFLRLLQENLLTAERPHAGADCAHGASR